MEKGEERRKQLLAVALDEFISKGFYGTSTRKICRKANISSGLLFHYFPNKKDIYVELVKTGVEKMFVDSPPALIAPREYLFQTLQELFIRLENDLFFGKMFVFINNAQHADVGIEKVRRLLEKADISKQWIPIFQKGRKYTAFIWEMLTLCV